MIMGLGMTILISVMILLLNVFLDIFSDDIAHMLTKMPRMRQYTYQAPVLLLCAADQNNAKCQQICVDRGGGWEFQTAGDRRLCRGPDDYSLASMQQELAARNKIASLTPEQQDENSNVVLEFFGMIGAHIESVTVYPSRAALDPIQETLAELRAVNDELPSRLPFYYMMVQIGFVILAVVILVAIIYWVLEDTPIGEKARGVSMIKGAITVAAFSLIIPLAWDPAAIFMENSAMYIMGVDGQHAGDITKRVVLKAGAVEYRGFDPVAMFNELIWHPGGLIGGLTDTVTGQLQEVFLNTILALARAQAVVLTVLLLFITSIVRVEVTMLAVMMYPITGALALLPIFTNYGLHKVVHTHIIGGLIAPITGAIIFAGGYATILAQEAAGVFPLEQWITSLTILIIASTVPIATMTWITQAAQQANATISEGFRSTMSIAMPMFSALGGAIMGGSMGGGGGGSGAKGFLGSLFGSAAGNMGGGGGGSGGGGSGTSGTTSAATAQELGGTTIPNMPATGSAPLAGHADSELDKSTSAINTGGVNPLDDAQNTITANQAAERLKYKAMAEAIAAETGSSGTSGVGTGSSETGSTGTDGAEPSDSGGDSGDESQDEPKIKPDRHGGVKASLLAGLAAGMSSVATGSLFNQQQSPLGGGMEEISKEVQQNMNAKKDAYEKSYAQAKQEAKETTAQTDAKAAAEEAEVHAREDSMTDRLAHETFMDSHKASRKSVFNMRSPTPIDGAPFGGGSGGDTGGGDAGTSGEAPSSSAKAKHNED